MIKNEVFIDPTGATTVRMVDEGGFYYIGKAYAGTSESDPKWQVARMTKTTPIILLYANGKTNLNQVWNDRASLAYS